MSVDYGWDQLHLAVHALASNSSNQRDRINYAINDCLSKIDPETDLPEELKAEFTNFYNNHQTLDNDIKVEAIIRFYDKICRYLGN